MASGTTITLNTGAKIPALGFGTWQDVGAQEGAVTTALKTGYRHIDTARIYGTEPAINSALKKCGIPRDQIFLTTKLWNTEHHPDDVSKAMDASLEGLGVEYVDLLLMHWPVAWKSGDEKFPKENGKPIVEKVDYVDTWKAMEKVYEVGKARAIGISNFSKAETERVLKEGTVKPAVHQMEVHPWLQQRDFVEWLQLQGIVVTQYSPFGNSNPTYSNEVLPHKLIDDPILQEIGKQYGKSGAQIALAWGISHGNVVIPKSKTAQRIKGNFEGDFKLEEADVKMIDAINKKLRFNDSSADFGWNFFADLEGKE